MVIYYDQIKDPRMRKYVMWIMKISDMEGQMKADALAHSVFKERFTIWICRGICKASVDEAPKAEHGITFLYLKADWTLAMLLHVLQS